MDIRAYLRSRSVPFSHQLHGPMPTATQRASSLHVSGERVAKAVLVVAGSRKVLAVLPATHRIDLSRLAGLVGEGEARIASEAELEATFDDCEPGAIPPFGKLYGLDTLVDASLARHGEILIDANTRHDGLRLLYRDFAAIERPTLARFAEPIQPRRRRTSSRRAG